MPGGDSGFYRKLSESKMVVQVSHASWDKPKTMTLEELHGLKQEAGKHKVEDFTQGPFLDFMNHLSPEEQKAWKTMSGGKNTGCTAQLTECVTQLDLRDTTVIAYNTQNPAVQLQILKKNAQYKDMYMVHVDEAFRKEFKLETFPFTVTAKENLKKDFYPADYLKERRLIAANKEGQVMEFVDADMRDTEKEGNAITPKKMKEVLDKVKDHFTPKKVLDNKPEDLPKRAPSPSHA